MTSRLCKRAGIGFWTAIYASLIASVVATDSDADVPVESRFAVEHTARDAGRAVLFIPGLATPGDVWDGTVARSCGADLYQITVRGFGGADDPVDGPVMAPLVDELVAWVDGLDVDTVDMVGHSLGGQVALQLAERRPDRVGRVVVVDSAPFFARLFNPAVTPEQASGYGAMMAQQMAGAPRDAYLAQARQGLPVQSLTETGQAQVMRWMEQADQSTVATAFGEVAGTDFTPHLDGVRADTTVMVAWAEGAPYSADQVRALYAQQYQSLDGVDIEVIEGARHFIMLDQPDAFSAALTRALEIEECQ
ncbi:alpha/beta fold hydrolase [Maricaulis sp. CAU 1757]